MEIRLVLWYDKEKSEQERFVARAITSFIQDGILMASDAPDISYVRHTCSSSVVRLPVSMDIFYGAENSRNSNFINFYRFHPEV